MALYTMYDLDGFRLIETGQFEAAADEDAVRFARESGSGDHVEIWQGKRKVRVVAPSRAVAEPTIGA